MSSYIKILIKGLKGEKMKIAISAESTIDLSKEILKEYNGEKYKPSTLESAVVHIVDSVVTKFDALDKETLSSSWNQDILVYQTMNENSAAGLYDKAGFSMNMFLKIRDYLIKEAKTF